MWACGSPLKVLYFNAELAGSKDTSNNARRKLRRACISVKMSEIEKERSDEMRNTNFPELLEEIFFWKWKEGSDEVRNKNSQNHLKQFSFGNERDLMRWGIQISRNHLNNFLLEMKKRDLMRWGLRISRIHLKQFSFGNEKERSDEVRNKNFPELFKQFSFVNEKERSDEMRITNYPELLKAIFFWKWKREIWWHEE